MEIENPQLNLEELNNLERKIREGKESLKDLMNLNLFMARYDKDLITDLMKEKNISSFEEYLIERKKNIPTNENINVFVGNLLGIISYLKRNLKS